MSHARAYSHDRGNDLSDDKRSATWWIVLIVVGFLMLALFTALALYALVATIAPFS